MTTPATSTTTTVKSGLRVLKAGEIIFNDGDVADSLYIIQKGQVRLFKPKGKGFIEIAVLRAGEVIGEMAYFDEDGSGRKRSCSAAAITGTDIIEISFAAFGKTMQSLNPWFKTIINTVVTRLRKSNTRIKELEDNQASVSYSGNHTGYEFIKPLEVMRILGAIFLVFKAHGELKGQGLTINRKALNLYSIEVFTMQEVKIESIITMLSEIGWLDIQEDDTKAPNILTLRNIDVLRQIFLHYNSERQLAQEKKLKISDKSEMLIAKMMDLGDSNPVQDIPNIKTTEDFTPKFTKYYHLDPVLMSFKGTGIVPGPESLSDGKNVGMFGELFMDGGKILVEVDYSKVQKLYPVIRFMNAVRKLNQSKTGG